MVVVGEHVVSKAIIVLFVHTHTGMVEDAELPYSDVTHSDPPSMEEMREIVCTQQHRPLIPDQWNRDEVRVLSRITHDSTQHIRHLTHGVPSPSHPHLTFLSHAFTDIFLYSTTIFFLHPPFSFPRPPPPPPPPHTHTHHYRVCV